MKNIAKYIGSFLMAGLTLVACSPDDYAGLDANGIPNAADADITMEVDQEINQVTLRLNNKAQYPVWIVDGKSYSTRNPLTKIYANSGDYTIQYRVGNRNGISDGMGEKSFHFNNSIVDFTGYISRLAGTEAEGKQWFIASAEAGHMGCGPSGTDGLEWWSANPNDKASNGVYDDVLTFTPNGAYTYDPGEGGTMYVNKEVKAFAETNGGTAPEDVMVNVGVQQASYDFTVEGNDVFLVLPSHTQFPYISNDDQWNAPKFKIVDLKPKHMELIYDNGSIAWHFILVTEKAAAQEEFKGFKYDSDCNMFRTAHYTNTYWYAPGWNQIADPVQTVSGSAFTLALPEATTDKWQCQYFFHTDMTTNSATNYDFSCVFNSTKDHGNVTVKICEETDDGKLYFDEVIQLKAYEDYVFYKSDMPGIDLASVKIVFDFGGNQAGTELTVRDIVLKEHGCDDGTSLPTKEFKGYNYDHACNMFRTAQFNNTYWYAPGWNQIADPVQTVSGSAFTLALPEATTDKWQCQYFFHTDMTTNSSTNYDFSCILSSTKDHGNVTVKICEETDDGLLYFDEVVKLTAYEDYVFCKSDFEGKDMANVKIVFDFGGNQAGTDITVRDIVFKEHGCDDGAGQPGEGPAGPSGDNTMDWDYNSANNLWKSVDATDCEMFFYYAPGWSQLPDPTLTHKGDTYTLQLPQATTDQWQAQMAFRTDLSAKGGETYDFCCVMTPNVDLKGVTVKLTQTGDDNNFFFAERVDLAAYEDNVIKFKGKECPADMPKISLFFDFGGNPDNTEVVMSKIYLEKK